MKFIPSLGMIGAGVAVTMTGFYATFQNHGFVGVFSISAGVILFMLGLLDLDSKV
jgi:hypothetical protein